MSNKRIQIKINNFLNKEKLYLNTLPLFYNNHLMILFITFIGSINFQQVILKKILMVLVIV